MEYFINGYILYISLDIYGLYISIYKYIYTSLISPSQMGCKWIVPKGLPVELSLFLGIINFCISLSYKNNLSTSY
jgi:hypothetical protein